MPPHAPPYKLVHVLTHAYLVPEPCAHPRRTSTGRGNHRAAAWRAPVQRYLSAQKGANFDGKKSDSKRGRIRAQRLPTQRGSYPRVCTAQESSPHMVGPRLKGIPTIRSDPPSGLAPAPQRRSPLVAAASGQLGRRLLCRPDGSGAVFSPPGRLAPCPPAYALLREKTRKSECVVVRVGT